MYLLVDSGAAEGVGASHPPVARVGERGGVHRIVDPPLPASLCLQIHILFPCCFSENCVSHLSLFFTVSAIVNVRVA